MKYKLKSNSSSFVEVFTLCEDCFFFPSRVVYRSFFPKGEGRFKMVISLEFEWFRWRFRFLIRK